MPGPQAMDGSAIAAFTNCSFRAAKRQAGVPRRPKSAKPNYADIIKAIKG